MRIHVEKAKMAAIIPAARIGAGIKQSRLWVALADEYYPEVTQGRGCCTWRQEEMTAAV
jgi:hypothetical protein